MSKELLEAKQEELRKLLFPWAKENGLAEHLVQIKVKITFSKRADTTVLSEEDWLYILDEERGWGPKERALLERIRDNGNNPTLYKRNEFNKDSEPDPQKMNVHLKSKTLFLSDYLRGGHLLQIKKRLVIHKRPAQKRARV